MKTMLALASLAAVMTTSRAQELPADKVPTRVKEAFQTKFPDITKVEWKLKSDKNYEAEFQLNGVEVAAKFDAQGKWLETESAIEKSALPQEVQATLAREYKDHKIVETQKVERPGGQPILFEVHLEKGEEVVKVQLERNGKVASKSVTRKKAGAAA